AEAARAAGNGDVARELERASGDYARALERLPADPIAALRPHAAWTSAATHAILPLLATDAAVRLQVRTGIAAHRARFGAWRGGFWLPECAYASRLDPLLQEAGVHAVVVDLTDVLGRGDARQLRPIATEGGPLLVPVDRATAEFVARVAARVRDGGLAVCAFDTELLGHWWHEGPLWLEAVLDAAAREGIEIVGLDDALAAADPAAPLD